MKNNFSFIFLIKTGFYSNFISHFTFLIRAGFYSNFISHFTLFFTLIFYGLTPHLSSAETNEALDKASLELTHERSLNNKEIKEEKKRFSSTAGFQQVSGFIVSSDHISQFFFNGAYQFKEKWSTSITQALNRHYFLNPNSNDKGLWIQDTALSLNRQFTNLPYKSQLNAGFSSTLPLSYYSQINDILTVSSVYLNWSLKLDSLFNLQSHWIKNLVFSIKPIGRYYLSLYTTSRTFKQSLGGTPLPEFLLGIQSVGLSLNITDYFSLAGSYGRWVIFPYKTNYGRDKSSLYDGYYQRHYYLFSLSGSWIINKKWRTSLSYSHVDRLDRQGRLEMVLFDDYTSTWALSVSYSFSFNSI